MLTLTALIKCLKKKSIALLFCTHCHLIFPSRWILRVSPWQVDSASGGGGMQGVGEATLWPIFKLPEKTLSGFGRQPGHAVPAAGQLLTCSHSDGDGNTAYCLEVIKRSQG